MKKSEVLELSKAKAKEVFKEYRNRGVLDILDDEIEVIGLKEYDDFFRIMIIYTKVKNVYCEFVVKKKSGKMSHTMYKKIDI